MPGSLSLWATQLPLLPGPPGDLGVLDGDLREHASAEAVLWAEEEIERSRLLHAASGALADGENGLAGRYVLSDEAREVLNAAGCATSSGSTISAAPSAAAERTAVLASATADRMAALKAAKTATRVVVKESIAQGLDEAAGDGWGREIFSSSREE